MPTRRTPPDFEDELTLLNKAERAYQRARREVFDTAAHASTPGLNERQRQILVELEAALTDLDRFRLQRRTVEC